MIKKSSPLIALCSGETSVIHQRVIRSRSRLDELLPCHSIWLMRVSLFLKEVLDRILAFTLLILLFPVLLGAMCLVKLTSRGPAIYKQSRVGQFGYVFTIYKIRTMQNDCESLTGPRWCSPRDPRITGVGKLLRKLHIDELPQLWNILKGEMSLIGPRPERPEIACDLRKSFPDYNWRLVLKPGISGLAQIHIPPDTGLNTVRHKLNYDRIYISSFSIWVDMKIVFFTALKMIGLYRLEELPSEQADSQPSFQLPKALRMSSSALLSSITLVDPMENQSALSNSFSDKRRS